MATAAEKPKAPAAAAEAKPVRRIPLERMTNAGQCIGDMQLVTLFEDDRIEEGAQDLTVWGHVGPRLAMGQWVQVTNDAGSFFRLMRVERIHGTRGSGLRALVLRDVIPPRFFDVENEPIVPTGDWYVRYLGPSRRWAVINPAGRVRTEGINSEGEARNVCRAEEGNPR